MRRTTPIVIFLLLGAIFGCDQKGRAIPRLHEVPSFALIDQRGKKQTESLVAGRVWIANVMFTSCPTVCPLMTEAMAKVQEDLASAGNKVQFVSVSIDPKTDQPEKLRAYIRERGVRTGNWTFLTGPEKQIDSWVTKGLKLGTGQPSGAATASVEQITHSTHFVLVDRELRVRGYYPSTKEGRDRLKDDTRSLLKAKTQQSSVYESRKNGREKHS